MPEQSPSPEPGPAPATQPPTIVVAGGGPNLLVRFIWFLLFGWWASGLVIALAWVLNVTVIGLPAGLWLLNRVPQVATLKSAPPNVQAQFDAATNSYTVTNNETPQLAFWIRALYFILVGWWFSGLWLGLAWVAGIIIVLLPLAFWMYGMSAKLTTLRR